MDTFQKLLSDFSSWRSSVMFPPFTDISDEQSLNNVDKKVLVEKLKGEFQKSKNSFVGIDDNLQILDFLRSPDMLAMLKSTGKKHILLEYPYYQQPNVDQLWEDKISPRDFVWEYQRLNSVHEDIGGIKHSDQIKAHAKRLANLVVKAKAAGIRIGFVDADLDTRDVATPHANCTVQDGTWRQEYTKLQEQLTGDFNKSIGRTSTLKDVPEKLKYLESHLEKYPRIHELMDTYKQWKTVRVSENNKFIAQLIGLRTQGEDFVTFFGEEHLESKASIPAYLVTIQQPSYVTRLGRNKEGIEAEYINLTSEAQRRFTSRDFTNPPDSVLLLSGPSGKPENYSLPAEWVREAKQVTTKGGYDSAAPSRLELKPIVASHSSRYEYRQVDPNAFAQSLVCAPAMPTTPQAREKR